MILQLLGDYSVHVCGSREYSYSPHGRSLEILRWSGVLKAKLLEETYEAKLEFPGCEWVQNKRPCVEGVWIFSGTMHFR